MRRPAPALRLHIDRYVGYHQVLGVPGIHRGLPSQHLTLIVAFDEPVDIVAMPNPAQPSRRVCARRWAPRRASHDPPQRPPTRRAARAHGPRRPPIARHAGRRVRLEGAGPRRGARPAGEGAERAPRRVARVGGPVRASSTKCSPAPWSSRAEPPAEVAWVWERLVATGGGVEVATLARRGRVGSRRHLGERFRQELRPQPEGGGSGAAVRARLRAAAPAAPARAGRRGRPLRLHRPGPPHEGVAPPGRLQRHHLDGRGAPHSYKTAHSSRTQADGMTTNTTDSTPPPRRW